MAKATHSTGGRVGLEIQDIHLFAQALFTYIYGWKEVFSMFDLSTNPHSPLSDALQPPPASSCKNTAVLYCLELP